MTPPSLYFAFTLRLYGHVLTCLRDNNFVGLDLFYRIKDCWKRRETPTDLLLRPLERGLSVKTGECCFDSMFDPDYQAAQKPKPYFVEGMHSQWVERERWPSRVKAILRARDRGKCAACGVDIVQELHEQGHIVRRYRLFGQVPGRIS
jgi:hypothetical protein